MEEKVMGRAKATTSKSPSDPPNPYRTPERPPWIRSSSCTEATLGLSRSTPAPGRHHTVPILSRPPAHHTPLHPRPLIDQHHPHASPLRQHTTPVISRPTTHSRAPHYSITRRSTYDNSHPSSPLEHYTKNIHLPPGSSAPHSRTEIVQAERGLLEMVVRERSHLERERLLERRIRHEDNKAQIRKLIDLKQRVAQTEDLALSGPHPRGTFMANLYADPTRRPASSTSSCGIEDHPQGSGGLTRPSNQNIPPLISARPIY